MSNDEPIEVFLGLIGGAIFLTIVAPVLNPITSIDLTLFAIIYWAGVGALAIAFVIGGLYAMMNMFTPTGGR